MTITSKEFYSNKYTNSDRLTMLAKFDWKKTLRAKIVKEINWNDVRNGAYIKPVAINSIIEVTTTLFGDYIYHGAFSSRVIHPDEIEIIPEENSN